MQIAINVSDARSNANDQIAYVARVLGKSPQRKAVFSAIHTGKKRIKLAEEIQKATGLPYKRVLEEGIKLVHRHIIEQASVKGKIGYKRDSFCYQNKRQILSLASHKKKLDAFPTKINQGSRTIVVRLSGAKPIVKRITVDDIDSFGQVIKVAVDTKAYQPILESNFKHGLAKLVHETAKFVDWGGETDDLFSTRLTIGRRRVAASFGLKGKGTKGVLTPKKMGKNGDQIQRLFRTVADAFVVQYWGEVDKSIFEQLKMFALGKSAIEGRLIYYAVIDGQDTRRLMKAYPRFFGKVA